MTHIKPYFAAYIPIKGNLNKEWDGTLVRDKLDIYGVFHLSHDIRAVMTYDEAVTRLEQVKLFLCSRDIKPNDKVKVAYGYASGICIGTTDLGNYIINLDYEDSNPWVYDPKSVFKIIDEIPDHMQINAGDEFDENILITQINKSPNENNINY